MKSFCFGLEPFQKKLAQQSRQTIAFDAVHEQIIRPEIEDAGMEPLRGDEEMAAGIIHKPMFERLMLCDFTVVERFQEGGTGTDWLKVIIEGLRGAQASFPADTQHLDHPSLNIVP